MSSENTTTTNEENTMEECVICCNTYDKSEYNFHCNSCKIDTCITCIKKYIMESNNDPNCIQCRNFIPYDIFMDITTDKWRWNTYKKHREDVLWEREQSKMPATVGYLESISETTKLQEELNKLVIQRNEINEKIDELQNRIRTIKNQNGDDETIKNRFKWTQSCPTPNCRGFLNSKYECPLCENHFCKECLENLGDGSVTHECNPDMVETMKEIKKTSKPCPTCGEFISKISGCDQMFCTCCGTAFSWNTGQKEKGIIHNPHAFHWFKNNPEKEEEYRNGLHNPCNDDDDFVPDVRSITQLKVNTKIIEILLSFTQNIFNFMNDINPDIINYLQNEDTNRDLRVRYLKNEIDETKFKSLIHARDKKRHYWQQIHPILLSTFEMFGQYSKNIVKGTKKEGEIIQIINLMGDYRQTINYHLEMICLDFKYSKPIQIVDSLRIENLKIPKI